MQDWPARSFVEQVVDTIWKSRPMTPPRIVMPERLPLLSVTVLASEVWPITIWPKSSSEGVRVTVPPKTAVGVALGVGVMVTVGLGVTVAVRVGVRVVVDVGVEVIVGVIVGVRVVVAVMVGVIVVVDVVVALTVVVGVAVAVRVGL